MSSFDKLKALHAGEWGDLGSALLLLPLLRFSLKIWGFQSVRAVLVKTSPLPVGMAADCQDTSLDAARWQEITRLARIVNLAAARSPIRANCLPRSLAIWWLLRRRGVHCELKLGVKPLNDGIQAHAWVEYDGRVLGDDAEVGRQFAAFEGTEQDQEKHRA